MVDPRIKKKHKTTEVQMAIANGQYDVRMLDDEHSSEFASEESDAVYANPVTSKIGNIKDTLNTKPQESQDQWYRFM